jgi:hypothetical protein
MIMDSRRAGDPLRRAVSSPDSGASPESTVVSSGFLRPFAFLCSSVKYLRLYISGECILRPPERL